MKAIALVYGYMLAATLLGSFVGRILRRRQP